MRQELSDTNASSYGRWTDSTLYNFIDRGNKRIIRDVLFPDCRVTQPTVPGVQLYQFPLMLKVKAIYVAGQLAVPSDLPTLEGRQIGQWDQSADGSTSSGPYSDAAPGTAGPQAPLWAVQEPLSYPLDNGVWCTPAPDAQPWDINDRPRYYWRGGWLGLVPAPSNSVLICVDGVRHPDTIVFNQSQITATGPVPMTTPDNFLEGVMWAACALAFFADDGQRANQQREVAEQNYEREKRKLIEWRGEYPGDQRNGPKVNTMRPAYRWYRKQTVHGGW